MTKFITLAETHRAYIYRVGCAIGAALVILGLVSNGQVSAIELLVGSVLGVGGNGLAAVHTSTGRKGARRAEAGHVNWLAVCAVLLLLILLAVAGWLHVG